MKNWLAVLRLFVLLYLFSLVGCTDYGSISDYGGDYNDEEDYTEIGEGTVSAGSGGIVLQHAESAFNGLTVTVNDDYQGDARALQFFSAPLPTDLDLESFDPVEEMLVIKSDDTYTDDPVFLTIPLTTTEEELPVVYLYNSSTRSLVAPTIVMEDEDGVTIAVRHFTSYSFDTEFKSFASGYAKPEIRIIEGKVKRRFIEEKVISGFVAGQDDWEFVNLGNMVEKLGYCSGQCLTALFYYDYRVWASQNSLYHLFDRDAGISEDNTAGIRLATVVQGFQQEVVYKKLYNSFFDQGKGQVREDFYEYYNQRALEDAARHIYSTGKPVFAVLSDQDPNGEAHAVIITAADYQNRTLWLADPNYPGEEKEAHLQNDGYYDYIGGYTADGQPIHFNKFFCLGQNNMSDWGRIGEEWQKFYNDVIGNNIFPDFSYSITFNPDQEDENTVSLGQTSLSWLNPVSTTKGSPFVRFDCSVTSANGQKLPSTVWIWNRDHWIKPQNDKAYVDLDLYGEDLYNGTIGICTTDKKWDAYGRKIDSGWYDFKWVNLSEVSLVPAQQTGEVDEELSWEVVMGEPPASVRFEWNFGDGTTLTVKDQYTASHAYQAEGVYPVIVYAYNDQTDDFCGAGAGSVSIGGAALDLSNIQSVLFNLTIRATQNQDGEEYTSAFSMVGMADGSFTGNTGTFNSDREDGNEVFHTAITVEVDPISRVVTRLVYEMENTSTFSGGGSSYKKELTISNIPYDLDLGDAYKFSTGYTSETCGHINHISEEFTSTTENGTTTTKLISVSCDGNSTIYVNLYYN